MHGGDGARSGLDGQDEGEDVNESVGSREEVLDNLKMERLTLRHTWADAKTDADMMSSVMLVKHSWHTELYMIYRYATQPAA